MSKPPAGLLEGTLSDFGAFDQCLDIILPKKNGEVEFRGQYCAMEANPLMPPIPKNFSLAKQRHAQPLDSIAEEVKIGGMAFYYLKFRLGLCVPSACNLNDMKLIAEKISKAIQMNIQIPQCYVKESATFRPIHIVVIFILSLLLLACLYGSIIEHKASKEKDRRLRPHEEMFKCFSFISNYQRLMGSSKGSEELKALHGLRALSMAWVILGHTYVWSNFQLLRRPSLIPNWFNSLDFEAIHNGWLSVEPFFFLSGLLTSYAVMKILPKAKGRINVPIYILRRYIRLTPPLLLAMGLAFFMPLLSSGPFWYERVDPELKACTEYWWANILYISNWLGMRQICVHPTWYLSADFQLHVVSIVVLYLLYRSPKIGLSLITIIVVACNIAVGVLTYLWDLPPTIQISSGNNEKIQQTVDIVHMRTFTHAGPYYVGIVVGFLMVKHKGIEISKVENISGWCASIVLALTSVYGAHRWNIGEPHGLVLTSIFAAVHRTTFTMSVAWVAFACVTGHGGVVNKFLSASLFAPVSRLTFMVYLLHSLVIWVRKASARERIYFSHYNMLYEYIGNIVVTLLLTVPFYLLLEAPLSNLERLLLSRNLKPKEEDTPEQRTNGHLPENIVHATKDFKFNGEIAIPSTVELTSVKSLDCIQNTGIFPGKNCIN
ncbi:nose resistant to fluoxetine protein 6-like [Stegodyphus dumicola]|uniref:nose resistant to fluoxetine protein 6-like n=1 Tax=Stegodyphus dumicola TaxID=202533 RepID=UPI0015AAFA2A|nr:nose resistant to fluoxetine protein 6-like [Stegodyphus dumicola]